jgi:hypothetical protein
MTQTALTPAGVRIADYHRPHYPPKSDGSLTPVIRPALVISVEIGQNAASKSRF